MKRILALLAAGIAITAAAHAAGKSEPAFTDTFPVDKADLTATGANRYFVLTPGFQLVLEGKPDGKKTVLTITVLNETKLVDGVETRVVEERETVDGKLAEISRNYFALSKRTNDVFYFGEDVDIYKNGKVTSHEGAWLSGVAGARFGLMIPGSPRVGARYHQEVAPGVALDRAEVVSVSERFETPAGKFENCLKTEESSALESGKAHKFYAPGIGLIYDGELKLVKSGRVAR
jgi:hypothetical protein